MTEQELKKLRRNDLLEILQDLSKENEVLRAQLDKARTQLTSRTIAVEKSGSLAEAALRINGVFEACQAAISVIFSNYKIHRLDARVAPDNIPSIKLLERLGFVYEGIEYQGVEVNGTFKDHYRYGLISTIQ